MDYQRIIETKKDTKDNECIHGLVSSMCGYCLGVSLKTKRIAEKTELEIKYDSLKDSFKSARELWTEDEFFTVYMNINEILGTKYEKQMIYQTAIELGRTIGAINWAKEHLWSKKEYHRGKVVQDFRKEMGIC